MDLTRFSWTREPEGWALLEDGLEIVTLPRTDL